MALLGTLGEGQGFLKAGFLGFQKSGKTWTSMLLAIGVRQQFGLTGPIAMYDTEGGSEYIAPKVLEATGQRLVGLKSRAFGDLCTMAEECIAAGVSVLIADSMTHVWRELCDAYLQQVNDQRKARNYKPRQKLEFQDWAHVKGVWSRWTDFYINSPLHIIICGRAGYEYDMEKNEETGRTELVKTGIKMKTEGEFGFEPSLLVEMERVQTPDGDGGFVLGRQATILGDRFGTIDGKTMVNPTYAFFKPHIDLLTPGAHSTVNVAVSTATGVDETGDTDWQREKKARTILCEEIQGAITASYPGQTAAEKKAKGDLLFQVFETRSWTAVENLPSERLRAGLEAIRGILTPEAPLTAEQVLAAGGLLPEVYKNGKCAECGAKATDTAAGPKAVHLRGCPTQPLPTKAEAGAEGLAGDR